MCVDKFQRQFLQLCKRLLPYVLDNVISNVIVYYVHKPLRNRGYRDTSGDYYEFCVNRSKIDVAFARYKINNLTEEHRHRERARNRYDGAQYRQSKRKFIMSELFQNALQNALLFGCHTYAPSFSYCE